MALGRAWAARSLNKAVDAWRSVLSYGVERRDLSHNVAASTRKVPRTRREMATYTPEEIRLVLRAADNDRNGHLWYLALGEAHADSGYVAINESGEPYTPDTLTRKWRKLTKGAGVRPIRLHDARHSCGTAMHLRGVPMAVIAKWLGHADAATTARIYAHCQDEALRAAGATLGQVVTHGGGHAGSTGIVTSS